MNDGLVLPFVLIGATLASAGAINVDAAVLSSALLVQLGMAPLVGVVFGWITAKALDFCQNRNWVGPPAQGVVFVATAFSAFLASETLGGNGFIATFVAGMVFGNAYRHDQRFIREFMEGIGQLLTMAAFVIFGAFLLPEAIEHVTWVALAIALGFLTVVRMGPIWLSLLGTKTTTKERLVLGWFGPRGIASVLFTLIVMQEFDFPAEEELLACVAMTVCLSIILHGFSSVLAARSTYASKNA